MQKIFSKWVQRYFSNEEALLLFLLLFVSGLVIWHLGGALIPVFAGLILAFMMQGGVNRLKSIGLGHKSAVATMFIAFTGFVVAMFLFILPAVWTQLVNLFNELPGMVTKLQQVLMLLPQNYPELVSAEQIRNLIGTAAAELSQLGQWLLSFSLSSLTGVLTALIYFVLVPILVLFFLLDGDRLIAGWTAFLPKKREMMDQVWNEMDSQLANYIRGKAIEILIVGVATFISFALLGINYAALLGLLVGLSVLIPYIGAAVVTVPVALIAFFQWGWSDQFLYLMLAYTIIQAIDGNVIVPLLFSEAVNLHPVSIIVAVLVFGTLWGFWGVFFAIPLATLVKSIVSAWPTADELPPPDAG
ncbi:pheromone autoinducer 2 transporter [Marinobacterium sp. xm-a-121]|uniref:AI-2E family transporter n=1 Tax=unclassified Marinobacterium TaxID=2644139 RepID=UPI001567DFD2|nr:MULTISPECIES: AI-2E family transporter [unclassified Marinobacterium]NRP37734.1 pheromone autoinducer 2 transporter [Marinobacterium sp. xm-a-121]NRP98986.1 pheromone autoinducer 2 transporter [Marinobacterium sp. xm-v-233]